MNRLLLLVPLLFACRNGTVAWPETADEAQSDSTAEYRVDQYIGGYDRMTIWRYDEADHSCAAMTLMSPVNAPVNGLSLPQSWSLEGVSLVYADDCFVFMDSWINAWSQDAEGFVAFGDPIGGIDVDVWATFEQEGFDDVHFDAVDLEMPPR